MTIFTGSKHTLTRTYFHGVMTPAPGSTPLVLFNFHRADKVEPLFTGGGARRSSPRGACGLYTPCTALISISCRMRRCDPLNRTCGRMCTPITHCLMTGRVTAVTNRTGGKGNGGLPFAAITPPPRARLTTKGRPPSKKKTPTSSISSASDY